MGATEIPENRARTTAAAGAEDAVRGTEAAEPVQAGADADHEHMFRSSWGLLPTQWRPVGSMALVTHQASLVYRHQAAGSPSLLKARKAYDLIASTETPLRAEPTGRGLELTVPIGLAGRHLKLLHANRCLPDALILPHPKTPGIARLIDQLRGRVRSYDAGIEVVIGPAAAGAMAGRLALRT